MEQATGWWGQNDPIIFAVFIFVALVVHFLPTAIAFMRGHSRRKLILVLNLLMGWTIIGWAVLLYWASKGESKQVQLFS